MRFRSGPVMAVLSATLVMIFAVAARGDKVTLKDGTGFPLIDRFGESIKITRGIVASKARLEVGADVMVDAKVNPGNSGGPILDRFGNVMAIVSMKSLATASEDSYGLGISAGQIRTYLAKNAINLKSAVETGAGAVPLTTEQIAAKVTPAAVCILSTR